MVRKDVGGAGAPLAPTLDPPLGGADVGEAAHGCAVPGSGCHASPSAAAPLRVIGDGATGERRIEPAASRDRLLGGRADVDGLVSWRAQERQKRSQKEEGKREEKKNGRATGAEQAPLEHCTPLSPQSSPVLAR